MEKDNMFKFKRTIRYFTDNMFKDEYTKTRKVLFQLLFALAMALRVSPKKLAKFYDEKKMDEYAQKFHDELLKADKDEKEKIKKALTIKPQKK